MAKIYVPPKQGVAGQLFDVAFLLALVFAALFLPLWLKIAVPSRVEKLPEGVSYTLAADGTTKQWTGLSWEKLGQNPTMQAQWEKLGYTVETAADIITQPFDYTIDTAGLVITGIVIIGFFVFLVVMSDREYRQVIAEKFDGTTDRRSIKGGLVNVGHSRKCRLGHCRGDLPLDGLGLFRHQREIRRKRSRELPRGPR